MWNIKSLALMVKALFIVTPLAYALPFNIVPLGNLPTTVPAGGSVAAQYTVTNNTGSTRAGNYVKYLPQNVTQVTTGSGVCGSTFTLAARGKSGDSCILSLSVTGPVNGANPNPQEHLFVCFPGGLTCAGTKYPLNVSVISFIAPQVSGGQYLQGSIQLPMIATSLNGAAWNYPINSTPSNLPSDFSDQGSLGLVSCSDAICIAAGQYSSDTGIFPLLAQSTDNAKTWSYQLDSSTVLPSDSSGLSTFSSSSCSGQVCVAGGGYFTSTTLMPMIAANTGPGGSWAYTMDSTTTPPSGYSRNGQVFGVACSGTRCLAAGKYVDGTPKTIPSVAISLDSGATWSYTIDKSKNLPPSFGSSGTFNSVSCDGLLCAAGGNYTTGFANNFPMLATSIDGAASWTYPISNSLASLPLDYSDSGYFLTVACHASICLAGGQYYGSGVGFPMLSVTTDGGSTWEYKVDATPSTLPADFVDSGSFLTATCGDSVCLAAGSYTDGTNYYPMLIVSTDGGNTWVYKVDKTASTLPADYGNDGIFLVASCTGQVCTAGGYYYNVDKQYPLLIETKDGGVTWNYQVDSNPSTLPSDYSNRGLFGPFVGGGKRNRQ